MVSIGNSMRTRLFILILTVCASLFFSFGAAAAATKTDSGAKVSSQLRKDWNLDDLQTTKKAVQAGTFPQDIRKSAIEAIDSYLSSQEKLLSTVDTQKDSGAAAKKSKATLEAEFQKKMKVITGNAEYKAELEKRIKAMKDQMNNDAAKANDMFDKLNEGKSTPQKSTTQPAKDSPATSKTQTTKAK